MLARSCRMAIGMRMPLGVPPGEVERGLEEENMARFEFGVMMRVRAISVAVAADLTVVSSAEVPGEAARHSSLSRQPVERTISPQSTSSEAKCPSALAAPACSRACACSRRRTSGRTRPATWLVGTTARSATRVPMPDERISTSRRCWLGDGEREPGRPPSCPSAPLWLVGSYIESRGRVREEGGRREEGEVCGEARGESADVGISGEIERAVASAIDAEAGRLLSTERERGAVRGELRAEEEKPKAAPMVGARRVAVGGRSENVCVVSSSSWRPMARTAACTRGSVITLAAFGECTKPWILGEAEIGREIGIPSPPSCQNPAREEVAIRSTSALYTPRPCVPRERGASGRPSGGARGTAAGGLSSEDR